MEPSCASAVSRTELENLVRCIKNDYRQLRGMVDWGEQWTTRANNLIVAIPMCFHLLF